MHDIFARNALLLKNHFVTTQLLVQRLLQWSPGNYTIPRIPMHYGVPKIFDTPDDKLLYMNILAEPTDAVLFKFQFLYFWMASISLQILPCKFILRLK